MNLVELGVKFTTEPQARYTNDGKPVHEAEAEFAYTDKGELKYAPIRLVRFGEKPLSEGIVSGQFRVEKFERPDGQTRYTNQVIVSKITPTNGVFLPFNSVVAIGGCGKDPEVKYFESGTVLSEVSLGVNRYKGESSDWFNLQFWGKTAQTVADYIRKGSKIAIQGELVYQSWNDRGTGELRHKALVKCDRFEFVGSKKDVEESEYEESSRYASKPSTPYVPTPTPQPVVTAASDIDYSEILF